MRTCGATLAATVTTARKAVTIAFSFIFFAKPFTLQYLWSGLIVVVGIYLNVYSKKHKMTFREFFHKIRWRATRRSSGVELERSRLLQRV